MNAEKHTPEFTLLQRHSPNHVELEFNGTLHNQAVTWQAHIHTLRDYCLHALVNTSLPGSKNSDIIQAQSFIDITIQNNIHKLTVALNLPVIDDAAILRTIIMIRQYKRLKPGRHVYGDTATFRFNSN